VSADLRSDLLSLVYTSTASQPFRETALSQLLTQCRALNAAREVTGMLLYRDARFIQVLEGPAAVVRALAETIRRDQRHQDMRVLVEEPIPARRFADWTMGYRTLGGASTAVPTGFRDSFADLDAGADRATSLRALSELTLWFRVRSGRPATI
jgi:hypothetical protein